MGVCRENGGCTHYGRGALHNLVRVCVGGGERALQNFFGGGAEVNILGSMWGTSKERENIL